MMALLMFSLALLSVLAANFPPGNSAPMVCIMIAVVLAATGLGFRFQAIREQYRAQRKDRR